MADAITAARSATWLRIIEIILGIIIISLGIYDIISPGTALATLILLLAIGLIVSACVDFVRAFGVGVSGWWRALYVITAILALILAAYVIANPLIYGSLTLVFLLGFSLLFAGIALAALGTPGSMVVGITAVIIGIVVIVFPPIAIGLLIVLLAVALIIIGVEALVAGITGRHLGGWGWI
jgi:uncharacterized membrane protein HdeD (DUF308 family)